MSIDDNWNSSWSSLFCFSNAALYVLILYAIPAKIRLLPRDNETHIKYRLTAASLATIVSMVSFGLVVPYTSNKLDYWTAIGLRSNNLVLSLLVTMMLMFIFYLGPIVCLVQFGLISMSNEVKRNGALVSLRERRTSLSIIQQWINEYIAGYGEVVIFRNIVFGPITEEVVFRAVVIPAMYFAFASQSIEITQFRLAAYSPLWFGVAHLHHFADRLRHNTPLFNNIAITLFQLLYTSIFGFMAGMLFLRTGNIYSPIVSHIICNLIGLPDVGFMNKTDGMNSSSEYSCLYNYRYLHLFLHALGLILFGFLLFPATEFLNTQSPYQDIEN